MDKTDDAKNVIGFLITIFIVIIAAACSSSVTNDKGIELEETVSAQSTWIAHLSTQVARQDQVNVSQWEDIGYLYTQMPYALGAITPVPPEVTMTPTPLSDQEFSATLTPTPSASIDIEYPPDMRTGIEEIDVVIDAILNQDLETRLELVRLTTTACTTATGLGGPPKCKLDELDGTIVDAFPVSSGEGHHIRPDQIPTTFDFTARGLVAVYVVPDDSYQAEYWPAGNYGIIFSSEDGGHPHIITVLVEEGQIVRMDFYPGWPPFDYIRQKSDEFILPPMR